MLIPGPFYTVAPEYAWCGLVLSATSSDCHAGYSTSSSGAVNSYTRLSAGRYRVLLPGLALGGNVQISAAQGNAHCNVSSIGAAPTSGVNVDVICRSPAGILTDSKLILSYYRDTNVGGVLGAYAHLRGIRAPSLIDVWNSTGGAASVVALGTGAYRVTFAGQVLGADAVLATAVGSSAAHCKVGGWTSSGSGVAIDVRCFNGSGSPVNGDVSISYGRNIRAEPRNHLPSGVQGGFSQVFPTGGVNASFSRNTCTAGSNTAVNTSSGNYTESIHARMLTGGLEVPVVGHVTALGTTGSYCNLNLFPTQGNEFVDPQQTVKCFSPDGSVTSNTQHDTMIMVRAPGADC